LACSEYAVLDKEGAWLYDSLGLQKRFLFVLFLLVGNDWAWVSINFGKFQVNNQIGYSFEITHGSGHEIELFFESIFSFFTFKEFQTSPLLVVLFDFVAPCAVCLVSLFDEFLGIELFLF
jgi:hypothetical protein